MSIAERQNERGALRRLAGQRLLYQRAKVVHNIGLILLVIVVALGFVAAGRDDNSFSSFVPLAILVLWCIERLGLKRWKRRLVNEAAGIQEAFDCHVLELPWPRHKSVQPPTEDRVRQLALAAKRRGCSVDNLENWYTPDAIPDQPLLAQVHCQRMSCWWDVNLRRQWIIVLKVVVWLLVVAALVVAIVREVTVATGLAIGASSLRMVAWTWEEIEEQNRVIRRATGVHSFLATFSQESLPSPCDVRRVQDEILDHRSSSPLVPEWFYGWTRRGRQAETIVQRVEDR